jgi:hypothetical protein
VPLSACQGTGIAPKKGKMRREFLTKRHVRCNSCSSLRLL